MQISSNVLLFAIAICSSSCAQDGVSLIPLDEREQRELGVIGVASEQSALVVTSRELRRPTAAATRGPREVLQDIADGVYDGGKAGLSLGAFGCARYSCLLNTAIGLTGMTLGAVTGGIKSGVQGQPYTELLNDSGKDNISHQALWESIDSLGLPTMLRDTILEKAQNYRELKFQLVTELPRFARTSNDGNKYPFRNGLYWPLHEQGIQSLLKVRICSIALRRAGPDQPFKIFIRFTSALFRIDETKYFRHRLLEYRGGQHTTAEWGDNDAALFKGEIDHFVQAAARQTLQSIFETSPADSHGEIIPLLLSATCE